MNVELSLFFVIKTERLQIINTLQSIEAALQQQAVLILDGALATELEARGARLQDSLWSARMLAEEPEEIRAVHLSYFRAGADVAITASYQATLPGFLEYGWTAASARRLIRRSVELAREAREQFWELQQSPHRLYPLIAASVGPYGAYLADGSEYRGRYGLSKQALSDFHQPRIEWLMEMAPDVLAFETLPCLREAELLLRLLEAYPGQQAWFSFSARSGAQLSDGSWVEEAGQLLSQHPQVAAVGINCTPPKYIAELLKRLSGVTAKPLLAYPNSGEGWDAERRCWLPESRSPLGFGNLPAEWVAEGAQLIGGCCRTRPEDIKALRRRILS